MTWQGTWRNQYGSEIEVTDDTGGRIAGSFRTALADSGLYDQNVPIVGVHRGDCIAFSSVGTGPGGDIVVTYAGLLREGRMETMWLMAADAALSASAAGEIAEPRKLPWWRAVAANTDSFERT